MAISSAAELESPAPMGTELTTAALKDNRGPAVAWSGFQEGEGEDVLCVFPFKTHMLLRCSYTLQQPDRKQQQENDKQQTHLQHLTFWILQTVHIFMSLLSK